MPGYIVRRILGVVPVLLATATIVWCLMFYLPGDPARTGTPADSSVPSVRAKRPTAIVFKTEPRTGILSLKPSHLNRPLPAIHFLK